MLAEPASSPAKDLPRRKEVGRGATEQKFARSDLLLATRIVGIALLLGLLPALWFRPEPTRVLLWFGVFGLLPAGILVLGFATWRQICPLSLVSRLPRALRLGGRLRVSPRWQERTVYLQLTGFLLLVSVRFAFVEDSALATLLLLVLLIVGALVTGFVFTGKTWCNHFCPMGMVERIYAGPKSLGAPRDSKCTLCTACKKNCPDIDLEGSYWKEGLLDQRRLAAYVFPGIVAGYVILELGAITPDGFAAAAGATGGTRFWLLDFLVALAVLVSSGFGSYGLFAAVDFVLERLKPFDAPARGGLAHRWATHGLVVAASFLAFNLYYSLMASRWFPDDGLMFRIAWLAAATLSGLYMWRLVRRTDVDYLRERIVNKMLLEGNVPKTRNWDPHEVYFREVLGKQRDQEVTRLYAQALGSCLADGVLNSDEDRMLQLLRRELSIPEGVHQAALKSLEATRSANNETGIEKRYQLESYTQALRMALQDHHVSVDEQAVLAELRSAYGLSAAEHESISRDLMQRLLVSSSNESTENEVPKYVGNPNPASA